MDDKFIITTIVTIALAVIGYLAKYANDINIANRKDKLERINRQLKEFYGPLLSLMSSSNASWIEFRNKYRSNIISYFDKNNPPTEEEKEIWRNWMKTIFIPINEKAYEIIIKNSDLIIGNEFPACFKDFCAHVETYRPILKKWNENDFTEHTALLNYPIEIIEYIEGGYREIKLEQNKLIKMSCS
ncbi:hypothetical protein EZ428_16190 [Pedobacter frigiditerrae]|uniref:Uncharacterized protein n=1 Tax=Pedobacter frigiditerrae TaxID=2530452 RepID=A0A4V2MI69_9SPHI|nr:hypothetical protein [Pedobacter frigiditerrae]TCC89236.1 hypothetical protein EZ428_16190 [Pedobacter frigiditerrae]